eukprot:CAMPEP_0172712284 /NCGR_PEP_ID=MMETSP1074-20121228/61007_1 /TAXON_ID=2916 /ORGANISM="Ceratium fusus, Strain PA161109" /LENGTH=183 /DNA_ID=CAMNT_0013536187 /DNA_START=64 /DNA_END=615 /DNA_ORIENTATION=-
MARALALLCFAALLAASASTAFSARWARVKAAPPCSMPQQIQHAHSQLSIVGAFAERKIAVDRLQKILVAAALGCTFASGFAATRRARSASRTALRAEASAYWEGEWICADCGYIYNVRAFQSKFEDLKAGFKCPACAAPRRRFARKLGDKVGTSLDGGDTPILIFSALALLVMLGCAYYALQ